ncbi:Argonaute complex, subunit Arb1 [Aspergillus egyptiacus]|nr:Argonaute complex, subunit Arb1 [Aspergillus egyptiacus]
MENKANDPEEIVGDIVAPPPEVPKKKKRNRRPKSKKGKNKPTGFEEYYVDPPITAEEHEFEQSFYDVSRPIIHRMEDALLRFQKNRRIETERLEVFHKYLAYGGVNVSPKIFAGTIDRDLKEMDKDQILLARGQTAIDQDNSHLTIDFNAVVKGYLTSYFPFVFNPENEEMIKLATTTIRSFLSYLLYHDVCPEYKENIDEARKSCDIAEKELWRNQQLMANEPGDFNKACSTLFGGLEYDLYVDNGHWRNPKEHTVQITKNIARKVVKFGLAVSGSDQLAKSFQHMDECAMLEGTMLEDIDGFEVVETVFLSEGHRKFYQDHAPDLHPVGVLRGRTYCDPGSPEYDLSPEEREEWSRRGRPTRELTFFLEESLLKHCYPGMKIITTVWEINCGFHYFEDIKKVYASIYTVLANDLMIGWKKPRDLAAKDEEDESDAE